MIKILYVFCVFSVLVIIGNWIGDFNNLRASYTGYKFVPNSYADQVGLVDIESGHLIINQHIVDYDITNDFLMILRMVSESFECIDGNLSKTIITHYSNKREYYLINFKENFLYGPYSHDRFFIEAQKHRLGSPSLSVPSNYYANSNSFKERVGKCDLIERL